LTSLSLINKANDGVGATEDSGLHGLKNGVSIIIPAYNEERTIEDAVGRVKKYGEVIVIDDGSHDETALRATRAGARVICHVSNIGYSAALRTGYLSSTREVVAIIDADMQQVPEELPLVIDPILRGDAEMVIGSKFLGRMEYRPNMPNLFMDKLASRLLRLRFGLKLTNSFSGMRAMRRSCIDFNYLKGNKHQGTVELDFSFAWHRYRVIEVPRTARRRAYGRSSIRIFDGLGILGRLFMMLLTPPPAGKGARIHRRALGEPFSNS
jgi:glycosyltransferase involved in cell wall biosynthesis